MNLKIRGFSKNEKVSNGIKYQTYYVNGEYPINIEKGLGYMGKLYSVPDKVMGQFLLENNIKDIKDIIGKQVEFYMNEQFKNQTFQSVGYIRLIG